MLQAVLQPGTGDNPAKFEARSTIKTPIQLAGKFPTVRGNYNYLNSNKSWSAKDSTSDTKESDLVEVDYKSKRQSPTNSTQKTKSATCAERKVTSHDTAVHEATKTKQWMPTQWKSLCSRLKKKKHNQ